VIQALGAALLAGLVLASICRATRPGGLLERLSDGWQWWLIQGRPRWLNRKLSGDCTLCTCFWVPGVPVAIAVALLTPGLPLNLWAVAVPFVVAVVADITIHA
jgi:hypothetical protein